MARVYASDAVAQRIGLGCTAFAAVTLAPCQWRVAVRDATAAVGNRRASVTMWRRLCQNTCAYRHIVVVLAHTSYVVH